MHEQNAKDKIHPIQHKRKIKGSGVVAYIAKI